MARTNIELDDELITQALRLAKVRSKREVVHLALKEFVENHQRKDVLELVGKVRIDPDYNHKWLRQDRDGDVSG
ncbi:MAG: type II toxin-antitoxin system VapB family antitoxin [Nitrococcus mobilis]|nr:type II toxin-antitoxin system VapB family antitoxin [Nitrococcus mobilis]